MDMMMVIYNALLADSYIKDQAAGRIKFYEYPIAGDISGPCIVIDPLGPPQSADYGDDDPITDDYLYQIDVWTKNRLTTKELAGRVGKVMRSLGFGYFAGSVDEYDKDTGIYRDARRYRGKAYTDEFES
ncbi:tail completion protein gp17 [Peribacillus sp. SCS-26]|uniref:tail completion protein gp17 n=1 Tax=Paraperibacillus marinus TaxID=3115295 RepID=UPI003906215E